jgi:hypothetical protein
VVAFFAGPLARRATVLSSRSNSPDATKTALNRVQFFEQKD